MTVPLGLQQLISSKQLIVKQETTFFQSNKYVVYDSKNKPFLFVKEERGLLSFGSANQRAFNMRLRDENKKEIIFLRRPYTFAADKMEVSLRGRVVGVVRQKPTMMTPLLYINDEANRTVLRIKGPVSITGACNFDLQTADKKSIGVIQKQWGGFMREMFTNSDQFYVKFPVDLDVRLKAAVLGTVFLIDFLYYERGRSANLLQLL